MYLTSTDRVIAPGSFCDIFNGMSQNYIFDVTVVLLINKFILSYKTQDIILFTLWVYLCFYLKGDTIT